MTRKSNNNPSNKSAAAAATAAKDLYTSLEQARIEFLTVTEKDIEEKTRLFKVASNEAIDIALPTLQQHRGWKQVFADIVSAILTVASASLTYWATNRFRLFKVETDSEKKLLELQGVIGRVGNEGLM